MSAWLTVDERNTIADQFRRVQSERRVKVFGHATISEGAIHNVRHAGTYSKKTFLEALNDLGITDKEHSGDATKARALLAQAAESLPSPKSHANKLNIKERQYIIGVIHAALEKRVDERCEGSTLRRERITQRGKLVGEIAESTGLSKSSISNAGNTKSVSSMSVDAYRKILTALDENPDEVFAEARRLVYVRSDETQPPPAGGSLAR